jgi:hypothetical protein
VVLLKFISSIISTKVRTSKNLIDALMASVIACESCIADCIVTGDKECILICRDCADLCELAARFQARESRFSTSLTALCAEVCKECMEECLKHAADHPSCKECAEVCKTCAEICEVPGVLNEMCQLMFSNLSSEKNQPTDVQ